MQTTSENHRFDVFGQTMSVSRVAGQWQLFLESSTGMKRRVFDVAIPPELTAAELAVYLDDIFHERASAKYPRVVPSADSKL